MRRMRKTVLLMMPKYVVQATRATIPMISFHVIWFVLLVYFIIIEKFSILYDLDDEYDHQYFPSSINSVNAENRESDDSDDSAEFAARTSKFYFGLFGAPQGDQEMVDVTNPRTNPSDVSNEKTVEQAQVQLDVNDGNKTND